MDPYGRLLMKSRSIEGWNSRLFALGSFAQN